MYQIANASSLDTLAERHYPELQRIARRMAGHMGIADDLVQDAFVAAVRHFDRYDPTRSFVAWMRSIIRHRFLRSLNDKTRRELPCEVGTFETLLGEGAQSVFRTSPQEEVRALLVRIVRDCVEELPQSLRQIFRLFYFDDMPATLIAERLGVSHGALRVRLHRGRACLRHHVERRLRHEGLQRAA